ncbi:[Wnt protein] O-palmitoleoyl-L-serine hydrolase [Salvia divinorum]|uniref:Pectin acetylesterase n=1 Tax=Salvia divinorum TaxID=28513 RepID=A0ABD1GCU8_SALDI
MQLYDDKLSGNHGCQIHPKLRDIFRSTDCCFQEKPKPEANEKVDVRRYEVLCETTRVEGFDLGIFVAGKWHFAKSSSTLHFNILMAILPVSICKIIIYMLVFIESQVDGQNIDQELNVTFISDAITKGAVCLDGTPGGYFFNKGFGDGINSWMIYLPGGAWCNSTEACLKRSQLSPLGSNKNVPAKGLVTFKSQNKTANPDFYNWNFVEILYCDGASFMADVEAVNPQTKLHLRGRRIFTSVIEELMSTQGMSNAENALLVGNSAGGLATILNCDRFNSFLPGACRVKCISDSGFFIRAEHLRGAQDDTTYYFRDIVLFHELAQFLPELCTQRLAPELCFFPENAVNDIQTPLFLLNSDFNQYQISKRVAPNLPNEVGWYNCTTGFSEISSCTENQQHIIKDFQTTFLKTLEKLDDNPSRGLFIVSCYAHDFIYKRPYWQGTPTLQNKSIQQAVGDWYFERSSVLLIDTQNIYPINCNVTV